jgi:hypothetical protein
MASGWAGATASPTDMASSPSMTTPRRPAPSISPDWPRSSSWPSPGGRAPRAAAPAASQSPLPPASNTRMTMTPPKYRPVSNPRRDSLSVCDIGREDSREILAGCGAHCSLATSSSTVAMSPLLMRASGAVSGNLLISPPRANDELSDPQEFQRCIVDVAEGRDRRHVIDLAFASTQPDWRRTRLGFDAEVRQPAQERRQIPVPLPNQLHARWH